jgi:hypothetical protein
MFARLAACLLCAGLVPAVADDSAPVVRVTAGAATLAEGGALRPLEPHAGARTLEAETGWVESGARSAVELVWRGRASATVVGPAAFELARAPGLDLDSFQVLELEVRRGTLTLTLADLGTLELGPGALQARALPGGVFELLNRGGAPLALARADGTAVRIPAGQRLRLRAQA